MFGYHLFAAQSSFTHLRGRKRRGISPPYQLFMILTKGTAIAESYASLVVDELTGVKITIRR